MHLTVKPLTFEVLGYYEVVPAKGNTQTTWYTFVCIGYKTNDLLITNYRFPTQ